MSISRRALLMRAAAWAAAQMAAARGLAAASAPEPRSHFAADPFALGVASGDPARDRATIWTRLVGPYLTPLEAPALVRWEVSENERFSRIVRAGDQVAAAVTAHAVHVDVAGLRPECDYFYRFSAGEAESRAGRFRTLPEQTGHCRIALTACQHWEQGFFSAYADLVRESPDLVLHVGDYIYEKSFGGGPDVRRFPDRDPLTLSGYRARHALYKTDPHLQAAHAAAAWLVAPDDHEVENDYAGTHSALADSESFIRRRANAYQAYLEHMPVSPSRLTPFGPRFHCKAEIGDLASLYLLDTRQFRSPQPGAPDERAQGALIEKAAADESAAGRSMLGAAQERWLAGELKQPQPSWTIIAQQTLFAPLSIRRPEGEMIWTDIWDGYPAARAALLGALSGGAVESALILGGDVHSFWRNEIKCEGRYVADEIVTSCLASRNAPAALLATAQSDNPHVKFLDNAHAGYTLIDLGRRGARVSFRAVSSLADADAQTVLLHASEIERRSASSRER